METINKQKKLLKAWKEALNRRTGRKKNKYHEFGDNEQSPYPVRNGLVTPERRPVSTSETALEEELSAWDEASDEDYEAFEKTLE